MYDGEHSITFCNTDGTNAKNTWEDWHLIPTSRPTMSIPGAQNKFVEIPGMNGSYDISEYLTSDVKYNDRTGSFEFIIDVDKTHWLAAYRDVMTNLHGKRLRMILSDDFEWFYEGRFTVDSFSSESDHSKVVIGYRVAPFKISIYSDFSEELLWDLFNFNIDDDFSLFWHIQSTNTASTYAIGSLGLSTNVSIRLVSGGPVTASFGGVTKTISTIGSTEALGFGHQTGYTDLTLTGNGVVDVGWRKVSL